MAAADRPPVRIAALGVEHIHAFAQVGTLVAAGAELSAFWSRESDLATGFAKAFPGARRVDDPRAILEDDGIPLVTLTPVPDERAALAAQAMRHGKDCLVDKPGTVTRKELATLRAVQAETGRRWVVFFSERFTSRATVRACVLVAEGAIGTPIHVVGLGPHRLGLTPRPDWFYRRERSGGILADLGAHQADQFLALTGARDAEVTAAQVANFAHPEHPGLEDFGEMLLRAAGATGYARVDWFTPDGLETWGDVRLHIVGTQGTLEVRKNCDPAGRPGGDHLILVDRQGVRHLDCADTPLPFGPALLRDVAERSETAVAQDHVFAASELALRAQHAALRLGHLADP